MRHPSAEVAGPVERVVEARDAEIGQFVVVTPEGFGITQAVVTFACSRQRNIDRACGRAAVPIADGVGDGVAELLVGAV